MQQEVHSRLFSAKIKQACWEKAGLIPNRDPTRWRYDAAGNVVSHELRGCLGCLCHDYDHIIPFSKGGSTSLDNCQVLQTRANRFKGNEEDDKRKLKGYSCSKQWSDGELDVLEMAIYGNVKDENGSFKCRCKSNFEILQEFADVAKLPKKLISDITPNC